jgi:hypothetical protein
VAFVHLLKARVVYIRRLLSSGLGQPAGETGSHEAAPENT